ncbi:MAG TPA: secretin N-terminal domain-containing protein [Candidatus Omnitrophota bacterium]|nr:secretin N-terminal domain-containing protein [Candidatus Omnitrophota bacterium]
MKKILGSIVVPVIFLVFCYTTLFSLAKSFADEIALIDVLDIKDLDVLDVFKLISQKSGLNIIVGQDVKGKISVYLKKMNVEDVLKVIVEAHGWAYYKDGETIQIMTDKNFEMKYGYKFGQEIATVIKTVLLGKATDFIPVLSQVKSSFGKIIADDRSRQLILMDIPLKIKEMENILNRMDVSVTTEVFALNYAKVEDVSGQITEVLTPGVGTMRFDKMSNKIIVSDTDEKICKIADIVKAFDERYRQVLIESKIVQIVLNKEHKMGVNWEVLAAQEHGLHLKGQFNILSSSDKSGKLNIGTLSEDRYTAVIETLETLGDTNLLSSPRIATLNNQEAKMTVGFTEPYVTSTTTTPSSGPATTAESVHFIDVGVKLYVTPTIHHDDFITMKIRPEISSVVDNLTTGTNNIIPIVETSQAETQVMVKNGVTIVIGGLIKQEQIKTTRKIPFLGSVPLVGVAFRSTYQKEVKTEIVIFLTPKIMTGDIVKNVQ